MQYAKGEYSHRWPTCEGDAEPREQGAGVVGLVGRSSSTSSSAHNSEPRSRRSQKLAHPAGKERWTPAQDNQQTGQRRFAKQSKLYIGKQGNYKSEKS